MKSMHPLPGWARWAAIPAVAVVVVLGVWVAGGVLTNDETIAKALTAVWLLAAGLVVLFIAWRYRGLAVPVIVTFVVVAGGLGGFLLYTSNVDKVVDEDVLVAEPVAPATQPQPTNVEVGTGAFRDGEHPTSGTATLIDSATGERVLTLTQFATDPGPDLRVYLVPSRGPGVVGGVDLGALKGNRGDQQYNVPESAPTDKVVIWCRAFSVTFGSALLA